MKCASFRWTSGLLIILLALTACGGENQAGVELQVAGQPSAPTATPSPAPTSPAESEPVTLPGRLLYLRGKTFELLDLASGDTTTFDDIKSFSTLVLNADSTRGTFVAFPNFGLLDLAAGTITPIRNTASTPTGLGISPDGRWLLAVTGTYRARVQMIALDGPDVLEVTGGQTFFQTAWTTDSRLVWWDVQAPDTRMIFDPAAGDSVPLAGEPLALVTYPFAELSPDGARFASIPIALPGDTACFDSSVALIPQPVHLDATEGQGQTLVWSEPGLVASSPHWLSDDRLLFVKLGTGTCGTVEGTPERMVMLLDLAANSPPRPVVGPLGNANDPNDENQVFGRQVGHLFAPSPDGRYVAWVGGGHDARETLIYVTEIATGETLTLLHFDEAQAGGYARLLEDYLIRQVIWLE